MLIKLAELRYRLLNDAPTDPNAAHEAPIAVHLPVLPDCRVAKIHAPNQIRLGASRKYPRLALHAQIRSSRPFNSLILQGCRDKLTRESDPKLRKLGYVVAESDEGHQLDVLVT